MQIHFTWKTKFFSREYEIYLYDQPAGKLNKQGWSRKSYGEMNGRKVAFEVKRIFKPLTDIIDLENNSVIGSIIIFPWKRKSTVIYQEKEYLWKFDNFWNTRWSMEDKKGNRIKYHSRFLKGNIDSYISDEVLILSGFFLRNYFIQRSAAAASV
ncbi:MAG: hypothetical protein JXN62_11670 [Bacteroidales bacterium]|nr:hypothetical protein [Bacteroidales bacterium]